MCLGLPLRITNIKNKEAIGEMHGIKRRIRIDLLSDIKEGDFVMVHAGFAIEKIDEDTARSTMEAIMEVEEAINGIKNP